MGQTLSTPEKASPVLPAAQQPLLAGRWAGWVRTALEAAPAAALLRLPRRACAAVQILKLAKSGDYVTLKVCRPRRGATARRPGSSPLPA